jgi:hypothetical protein
MSYPTTQMLLLLDDPIPEHIKQTFKLTQGTRGWESDLSGIDVAVLGQDIDVKAAGYVVVYADDEWHQNAAVGLFGQLKSLRQDALILGIPVEVEVTASQFTMPDMRNFNIVWKP